MIVLFQLLLLSIFSGVIEAGIPTEAEFFPLQLVNHLLSSSSSSSTTNSGHANKTTTSSNVTRSFWKQRFYRNQDHFQGPGHPILLILGGEGAIEPSTGIFYPVVVERYAKQWGALVLEPEHRFYGKSWPVSSWKEGPDDPRSHLFTSEQALHDAVRLVRVVQLQKRCSLQPASPDYCPVVAIGGSYPGWLAAMARLLFPKVIDIGYAASAPMRFYAQQVDQYAYYNHISKVAETAVPGCSGAVKTILQDFVDFFQKASRLSLDQTSQLVGVCPGTLPSYISQQPKLFVPELLMVVAYTFANHNMAYYPPSNQTSLVRSCRSFLEPSPAPLDSLKHFLTQSLSSSSRSCWNMTQQLPSGPRATLSAGDWSGVGTGPSGESWDFQTCTLLVEAIGFGPDSMFPMRDWSLDWLTRHCQSRFGVTPQPSRLVKEWRFDDLVGRASRILFTNGLRDGWSVSGIQQNLSDTLLALNFPNGAHHSDLNGHGPRDDDTEDIAHSYVQIESILGEWLESLPSYQNRKRKSEPGDVQSV